MLISTEVGKWVLPAPWHFSHECYSLRINASNQINKEAWIGFDDSSNGQPKTTRRPPAACTPWEMVGNSGRQCCGDILQGLNLCYIDIGAGYLGAHHGCALAWVLSGIEGGSMPGCLHLHAGSLRNEVGLNIKKGNSLTHSLTFARTGECLVLMWFALCCSFCTQKWLERVLFLSHSIMVTEQLLMLVLVENVYV